MSSVLIKYVAVFDPIRSVSSPFFSLIVMCPSQQFSIIIITLSINFNYCADREYFTQLLRNILAINFYLRPYRSINLRRQFRTYVGYSIRISTDNCGRKQSKHLNCLFFCSLTTYIRVRVRVHVVVVQ